MLRANGAMLLRFVQIVYDPLTLQMCRQRTAATRIRIRFAWRGRRFVPVVAASLSVALQQVFNVQSLRFQFGLKKRQLFFGDLFAAASASCRK